MKIAATLLLALCAGTSAFSVLPAATSKKPLGTHKPSSVGLESSPWAEPWSTSGTGAGGNGPWDVSPQFRIEGQARHPWQFGDVNQEVVQVTVKSEGRPMHSVIELWVGPDWTPLMIKAYSEDGAQRPVQTLVGTRNKVADIEVRNVGPFEFPVNAAAVYAKPPMADIRKEIPQVTGSGRYIEGGAVYSVPFEPGVEQVQVLLNTDTRQLNAKVELLNGPNNKKQEYEIFTNNGLLNALYVVFNTPGTGNTIRVTNIAPLEFPCKAYILPV